MKTMPAVPLSLRPPEQAKRLKVLHVVLSLDCGGLEHVVLDLIRQGRALGQDVNVLCLERRGELADRAESLGAQVDCLDKPPGLRPWLVKQLWAYLRDSSSDVLHSHQLGALFYSGPAAMAAGVPVVIHTEHGKHYAKQSKNRWLGRFAARFAHRLVGVSADVASELVDCGIASAKKVATVTNGIDIERFSSGSDDSENRLELGIPKGARVVGTLGRLNEVKRQDLLLRAFAQLRPHAPDAHLLLIGDGPKREALQELAESLNIAGVTHFAGYRANPEMFLPLMDVFALTSASEGMPLAVLEAWAAGVPVLASRVGGLPEMIEDGKTGWLYSFGDETALTRLMRQALENPDLAKAVAGRAKGHVEAHFGLRRMAEQYQEHYLELLGKR